MEGNENFWENVLRYPRFLISFSLGIFFFLFEQIKPLFQNPVTGIALVTLLGAVFAFLYFTLKEMLGI